MRESRGPSSRPTTPRRGRWSQAEQARLRELWGLRDEAVIARELNRPIASVRRMAERLFPPVRRKGPWTAAEVLRLKRYLGASSPEVIARVLGRDPEEVRLQIIELGRIRREDEWSREEIAELKRLYGTRTTEDLELIFGRSGEQLEAKAKEYALSKDKAFLRKLKGESATRMPRWSAQEVELLQRDYATRSNLELARELGRSVKSVVSKAHNLGLKKSPARLREMGRQNVSLRYEK